VLRRFRKEARLMAEANNPYVVNLLEYNEEDGVPYLVLEFVAGASLSKLLAERTRLDEPSALTIMAAVARGLMEAHERGIVHRDIKPANILLLEPRPSPSAAALGETVAVVRDFEPDTTTASPSGPRDGELAATAAGFSMTVAEASAPGRSAPRIKIT